MAHDRERTTEGVFLAELLESGIHAYAALAADRLITTHGSLADMFGSDDSFNRWRDYFEARLNELITAVEFDEPGLFAQRAVWAQRAFVHRGVAVDALVTSLRVLLQTLDAELPSTRADRALRAVDAGIIALESEAHRVADSAIEAGTPHGQVAARFLLAVLNGDRRAAVHAVLDAVPDEISVADAYLRVLIPAEIELGRLWHADELGVGEEHFATSTVHLLLGALYPRIERAEPNGYTVITDAVSGNQHTIAARVLADFMEMGGWRVIDIQGPLPPQDLIEASVLFEADLVALSATLTPHLRTLRRTIERIRADERCRHLRILVGGSALDESPDLWRAVGADGYTQNILEASNEGLRLVQGS